MRARLRPRAAGCQARPILTIQTMLPPAFGALRKQGSRNRTRAGSRLPFVLRLLDDPTDRRPGAEMD